MSPDDNPEMPELVEELESRLDELEKQAKRSDAESAERAADEIERSVEDLLDDLETVEDSFQDYDESMRRYVSDWVSRLGETLDDIDSRTDVNIQYDLTIDAPLEDGASTYGAGFANRADSEDKTRRGYLRDIGLGLGALGGLGIVGFGAKEGYDALTGGEQPPEDNGNGTPPSTEYDVAAGETYSWDEFNNCLSEDQKTRIEESLGNPEDFEYEPQSDGELYDVNIIEDNEVIAYLDNEGLECEVDR